MHNSTTYLPVSHPGAWRPSQFTADTSWLHIFTNQQWRCATPWPTGVLEI
jgi:hypothetical protein